MFRTTIVTLIFFVGGCATIAGIDGEYALDEAGAGDDAIASSSGGGTESTSSTSVGSTGSTGGAGGAGGQGGGPPAICGNGIIEPGEECDDQNAVAGDECESCKVMCKWVKNDVNHHCYIPSDLNYSWSSAKSNCAQHPGYYLVSITSQEEMEFVAALLPSVEIWLGGIYQGGAWTWVSGEPWGYAPWSTAQPDGDGQCVKLGPGAQPFQGGSNLNNFA
jgi:cysteine-rich repeat protein